MASPDRVACPYELIMSFNRPYLQSPPQHPRIRMLSDSQLRVREKITSQNWRSDLVQVWLIGESKTTGIASYFEAFESEVSAKDGLKLRCENVKLFLREP